MSKGQFADALAARTRMQGAAASQALGGVFTESGNALARGDEVRILGFGAYVTTNRPARTVRNPRPDEVVVASTVLASRPPSPSKTPLTSAAHCEDIYDGKAGKLGISSNHEERAR